MPRTADSKFSEVHLGEQSESDPVELDEDKPFRILLMGDFSGRAWRKNPPRSFTPHAIDRDNFEEVMEDMDVALKLHGATLKFREIEDFHPDKLYHAAAPLFREVEKQLKKGDAAVRAAAPSPAPPRAASGGSLLDMIVSEQGDEPSRPAQVEEANDLAAFIARVSKGHTEAKPTAEQKQRAAHRESLESQIMRGLLRHPHLQHIEAAWRAVSMLVRGLDTDGPLRLYVLDITLPELISELDTVRQEIKKKGPWAVIIGNYSFGQTEMDTQALHRIARLASSMRAPFLAEAHLHGEGETQDWHDFRRSAEARWIGLALPRFLMRLPYGKETSAIESFAFEEMPQSEHQAYLWGNPAFFCALLLGKSFLAHGWDLNPIERRIDNLPMHVYRDDDGESVAKPVAEVLLTEREALNLLDAGFMPVASLKHEPAALIVRFQSIAEPTAPLAGLS